ncbi:hypothetical protein D9758_013338 [Tetrapyrgos nigripes]|uniref:Cytochrome P450 n=1 Tax=Tetrapyrgos nigripes TaxID=182062 RepID=A0A8H5CD46_9AGAR|nr:hypothetical protein D9758_013338 [Tetrapyrgos nigripes]
MDSTSWLSASSFHANTILVASTCTLLPCLAYVIFQRLLNPLIRFPGPTLAKWTSYYMAYYDIWKGGGWIEQLQELHQLYGPVVRVGPNQLHFNDPQAYADIYSSTSKFTKDPDLYGLFPADDSLFTQTDPRKVSARKPLVAPFFSRQMVLTLEETIQSTVDTLIRQLLKNHSSSQAPANLNLALRSATFDIITTYCFAKSINTVSYPNFHNDILVSMDTMLPAISLAKHFRIVKLIILNTPHWLTPILVPSMKHAVDQLKDVEDMVERVMKDSNSETGFSHRTVFHSLLDGAQSGGYGARRKTHAITKRWLADEGAIFRFAGSDTGSSTCVIGCRYVLADGEVLGKLVKELDEAWPDKSVPARFELLEKLPYLTAVIKESLRLSPGVTSPLARIVGAGGATIAGHFVPEGTSVAMANSFVHLNPDIFADPGRFKPERWLQPDSISLEKHLVAFGKGSRSCIGTNLAWCELYLIMGNIFRKLDLTPTTDVRSPYRARDYFVPLFDEDILHHDSDSRGAVKIDVMAKKERFEFVN